MHDLECGDKRKGREDISLLSLPPEREAAVDSPSWLLSAPSSIVPVMSSLLYPPTRNCPHFLPLACAEAATQKTDAALSDHEVKQQRSYAYAE